MGRGWTSTTQQTTAIESNGSKNAKREKQEPVVDSVLTRAESETLLKISLDFVLTCGIVLV